MDRPPRSAAKALAIALGLAVALVPAASGMAASKKPAKHGTVKGCSLKKKAKCKKARITKAKVGKVNLTGTDLSGATITGATFSGTDLTGVNLARARITNTTFINVTVTNLDLSAARLRNVTFSGARSMAKDVAAREAACTTGQESADLTIYECTLTAVNMRGAVLDTRRGDRGVRFRKSTIPRSDFRGITASGDGGAAIIGFTDGTDVSQSYFGAATTTRDGIFEFQHAVVQESVLDGAWFSGFFDTDATNATMLGAYSVGGGTAFQAPVSGNTLTGVRGLAGATAVTIVGADGAVPSGLRTVQVHENGYFRPGILCDTLPCARGNVAVGAPVVATAAGTEPLVMSIPGWTCASLIDSSTGRATVYRASCSTDALPAGAVSGVLSRQPVSRLAVTVTSDDGAPGTATAITRLALVATPPGSSAPETTTCVTAATCTANVIPGSTVSVKAMDTTRVLSAVCPGATDAQMAALNQELACPGRVVDAALGARVVVRPGAATNVSVVDAATSLTATPIATLRWWVRAPGLDAGAIVNCDGRATCNTSLPLGATVRFTLGDPALDTSGFCPGPSNMFYFRLPGTVSTCPEYTVTAAEDVRIETS